MLSQKIAAENAHFVGFDGQRYQNSILYKFGTPDCIPFRQKILERAGGLSNAFRAEFLHIAKRQSHVIANQRFTQLDDFLNICDLHLICGADELNDFTDKTVARCEKIRTAYIDNYDECLLELSKIAHCYKISTPKLSDDRSNILACIARMCCQKWWRRNLRKLQITRIEAVARDLRQVNAKNSPYCSNISLKKRRLQKQSNLEYLQSRTAVNELNQEFTLSDLAALSVSNPTIRRIELITRCRGFETIANSENHRGVFITLTTPSRFHRMIKIVKNEKLIKCIPNKNYSGLTPRDAQEYLCKTWGKIQAKLSRENIKPYGFRIAEPHHDGTPHWHFLLFSTTENIKIITDIFTRYSLEDSPEENGATQHRLKIETIKSGMNPATGREYSATGYLIKYICKNIDGYGVDNTKSSDADDWSNRNSEDVAEKIEAWARTHRIRQFQQIGGASVTVWREMRRLSEQDGVLEEIRLAAHSDDWAAFVQLMGGATVKRDEQTLRPAYAASEKLDRATGEITPVLFTQYGDAAAERVVGVITAGIIVLSRIHYWEITENENVRSARRKIMDGMCELLLEIRQQGHTHLYPPDFTLQQAKPAALDLYQ